MADDQVKYSDLIAQDVQLGLTMLAEALKAVAEQMASLKTEATALKGAMSAAGTATREQQQATAQQAASVEGLSKKVKQLTEEERRLDAVRRSYKKLTDDQIARVDRLAVSLSRMDAADQASIKHAMALIETINIENKSYNELQATYNALMATIKNMNTEQLRSSQIGKTMVATANKIRETMNETQKSVGNYTLQVGKYRAAFDGLGYSFQQILREAPSALNLNQFFLAISNNVPMFTDQLKAFKDEQAEIKANLAQMTEGTKEYAEQLGKVESVGKKLGKVLISWQSLVLVGLMILRNWDRIVSGITSLFINLTKEQKMLKAVNEEAASSIGEMTAKFVALQKEWQNLKAENQGEWLKQHKDDWQELGYSIDDAKKAEDFYVNNTAAVQKAIDDRARSIAAMKLATEKYEEAFKKQVEAEQGKTSLQSSLGSQMARALAGAGMAEGSGVLTKEQMDFQTRAEEQAIEDLYNKRMKKVEELKEEARQLVQTFVLPDQGKTPKAPKEPKTPKDPRVNGSFNNSYNPVTMADVMVEEANAMRDKGGDVLAEIQLWYDKKVAIAEATYTKQKEVLQREKTDRERSLTENLNNARIFVAKYNDMLAQLDKDHAAGNLDDDEYAAQKAKLEDQLREATALIESEKEQRQNITDYYNQQEIIAEQKKNNELADLDQQRSDKLFKEEQKRFKEHQDVEKRRFELEKHNSIERAKFDMEQEIASKQWQIDHAKELELSEEQLAVLKEEVEWLNKKYNQGNYNAKRGNTGNYSNIMDVLFGEKITNDQISALNSVFDQAKAALNSWMDARKAAADQAKELADDEVSAAENALNREIELRNQGYANDVALREKELADAKEQQKKALEMQQKAKEEELAINTALEASNMAVAIANLIKQFGWWSIPMIGVMLGAWSYAKASAFSQIRSTKYRDGGVMLLEGGSHESGHDVNLGIGPDGSNLRAEGGEYFAVINKRSSRKYGSQIPAVVNALNSGMFEDRYIKTSDAMGLMGNVGVVGNVGESADLSRLESGVGELVKQGEQNWTIEGDYRVLRYKNLTRRVKIG